MKKYVAMCGNTSRTITGCNTAQEALDVAIKAFDDCLDHTEPIEVCSINPDGSQGDDCAFESDAN